jgi:exonuclease III
VRFSPGQGQLTLAEQLKQLGASIICFQETKISRNDMTEGLAVPKGWSAYFSFSQVRPNVHLRGVRADAF